MNAQRSLRQRVEVEEVYPQGARRIRKGGIAANGCAAPARITILDWPGVAADASQSEPCRQARPSVLTRGGKTLPQAGSACRGCSIGRVPTKRRSVGLATTPAPAAANTVLRFHTNWILSTCINVSVPCSPTAGGQGAVFKTDPIRAKIAQLLRTISKRLLRFGPKVLVSV